MAATIEQLSTENEEVATIIAAHNAAASLAKGGSDEAAISAYGKYFATAYEAIRKTRYKGQTPGVS